MRSSLNNGANQLNPNSDEYWRSRGSYCWVLTNTTRYQKQLAALGEDSLVLVPDGPEEGWRPNVPQGLADAIAGEESRMYYVALGQDGSRYFVRFENGRQVWRSNDEMLDAKIKQKQETSSAQVSMIAFAADNGYFVLFDTGYWQYRSLPDDAAAFLNEQRHRISNVDHMSFGIEGEWFASFNDGQQPRWKSSNLPQSLSKQLCRMHGDDTITVHSVEFGSPGCWHIRYNAK